VANKGREIMKKRWIGLVLCLAFGQAQAASFDCGKAGTKVETLACDDARLSNWAEKPLERTTNGRLAA
jgi:uncharacterized protein